MRGILIVAMLVAMLFVAVCPMPAMADNCGNSNNFNFNVGRGGRFLGVNRGGSFFVRGVQREFIVRQFVQRDGDIIGVTNLGRRVNMGSVNQQFGVGFGFGGY